MRLSWKNTLIAAALMLLTAALLGFAQQSKEVPPKKPLSEFPLHIGDWRGQEQYFGEEIYDVLGVDDSFLANYGSAANGAVNLYIGYYRSQKEGDLIHSPKNCMPGAGWGVNKTELEKVDDGHGGARVIKLFLTKGPEKQVMLYWFHSRGRIISSEYRQKIYLVVDSITRRRTDGAFVRLLAPVADNDVQGAVNTLKAFAAEIMPILDEYLPV